MDVSGYIYKPDISMDNDRLLKYIKGEITSENELIEILDWIEASPRNQKRYNELKNLWVITGFENLKSTSIPIFSPKKPDRSARQKRIIIRTSKYAAVLILAFLLSAVSLHLRNKNQSRDYAEVYNEILVPLGERKFIALCDGTRVWLNSGTTLRYPPVFSGDTRMVFLKGEAYFDVVPDQSRPFNVNAEELNIEVLGTQFNVSAYPEDQEFLVTLEEGSVEASQPGCKGSVILKPGEQAIYSQKTQSIISRPVDTGLFTSWKENELRFENAQLAEIIKKMERWYDVEITTTESVDLAERYTMSIKDESLKEILDALTLVTDMKYDIVEKRVSIENP
jgi:ferric-dicitrate binding protein FerR (iron transport regulator)